MTALDTRSGRTERAAHRHRAGVRWSWLVLAVCLVLLIGYLAVAGLLAVVIATAEGARFSVVTALLAALPAWLAMYQVPLSLTSAPLTALPLLPTALVMLLIGTASSWVARRSRSRRPDQALRIVLAMGLSHAVAATVTALALGGPVSAVPIEAFLCCGLVATAASALGVANRCGLTYLAWRYLSGELWCGLRVGLLAVAALVGAGALVLGVAIGLSATEMYALSVRFGSLGDAFGGALLSLLYVPDAVLAGWAFATGTGLSVGALVVRPFGMTPGPVPDVPLLAVLPVRDLTSWWWFVFAVPAGVGVLVGWASRHAHESPTRRLRVVGVATAIVSLAVLGLTVVVGGRLGGSLPVTLYPWGSALATACWVGLPAAATAWFTGTQSAEENGPVPENSEQNEVSEGSGNAGEEDGIEESSEGSGSAGEEDGAEESQAGEPPDDDREPGECCATRPGPGEREHLPDA